MRTSSSSVLLREHLIPPLTHGAHRVPKSPSLQSKRRLMQLRHLQGERDHNMGESQSPTSTEGARICAGSGLACPLAQASKIVSKKQEEL